MTNCPRCNKKWDEVRPGNYRCEKCKMFYYSESKMLDWQIIFGGKPFYISWYFDINECYFFAPDSIELNEIKFPKMLPFNISIEKIENLLLII